MYWATHPHFRQLGKIYSMEKQAKEGNPAIAKHKYYSRSRHKKNVAEGFSQSEEFLAGYEN